MATIERFEDIVAWQKGRLLVIQVYAVSEEGTFSRDFGLKDQIRRAAVSVTSNIAEGFERGGNPELIQFLSYAKGSAGEVRSQLYNALDAGHLEIDRFAEIRELAIEVSKLIHGFREYLLKSDLKGPKYVRESIAEYINPKSGDPEK